MNFSIKYRESRLQVVVTLLAGFFSYIVAIAETPKEWEVEITSNLPAGVALMGEPAEYRVRVQNRSGGKRSVQLVVDIYAAGEGRIRHEQWDLSFENSGLQERTLTLSTAQRGYWSLLATLNTEGRALTQTQGGLVVVEKPRNYGKPDPESFFGSMFNRVPEAGQRIGVKFERQMTVWEWFSGPTEGTYNWEKLDARMDLMAHHNISVVLVILTQKTPKWAKWNSFEELAQPEPLSHFQQFIKDVIARYRGRIAAIEILNEPDLECAKGLRGSASAARIYATLLRAGYDTVKSVAPEIPVLGLDVSGEDFPDLRFATEVMALEPTLDAMSGHPYTSTRYLGGGAVAESPDRINAQARMMNMAELMKKRELKPRLWPTEFGWGLHKDELMSSPDAELWAAYAAQAITMVRSVPEVEKLFWFSMTFPGYEGQFTYGMFRGGSDNYYPTPVVAAYATCARYLDRVRFIRRFSLGAFVQVYRFVDSWSKEGLFVLWLSEPKSAGGEIQIPSPSEVVSGLDINDGYGRVVEGDLTVRAMPLFLRALGSDADRIERYLKAAPLKARETLLVERIYISTVTKLGIDLANNSGSPLSIKLFPQNRPQLGRSLRLAPGRSSATLSLDAPLSGEGDLPVELLEEASGKKKTIPFHYNIIGVPKLPVVKVDGVLDEAKGLPSQVRNTREDVYPRDPGVEWNGASDLSLEVWTAWTHEGMYLAVKVTDDVAAESGSDETSFWKNDSLQIAWDMGNRADSGYNAQCVELGIYRKAKETLAVQTYPERKPLSHEDLSLASCRIEGATLYEMLVPWRLLGNSGMTTGRVFRFNIIANDNDGTRRKCWIGLTPGIGEGKHPSAYLQWALQETP